MALIRRRGSIHGNRAVAGWLFVTPMILVIGLFLLVPVVMAAWVSVSDWSGIGPPFAEGVNFVGMRNYTELLGGSGLATRDLGTAMRNNLYYVLFVVPLQTAVALWLALLVNRRIMRSRGFFRTTFYFPSVTSAVAITVLWLFLFSATGPVNKVLSWLSIDGPNWFFDPRGIFHIALGAVGITSQGNPLTGVTFLGISGWEWVSGPSVAMTAYILMAVFTTTGTFMLLFIAGLQQINQEVEEAAMTDGANGWQRFWYVTLPMLKPTVFTVVTLGLIGTWQVFEQIYTGTKGGPAKTTLTPAYLSFDSAFLDHDWPTGAAIAFILFAIIVVLTVLQRLWLGRTEVGR
jgi:multiple sugar transport system permease protein